MATASKHVCFFVSDRELAAPIDEVRETVELRPITRLFHTPRSVAGIASLRGEILPVLDPGVLLGLAACARGPAARIVIVAAPPLEGTRTPRVAGLLVDRLGPIRDLDPEQMSPPPPTLPLALASMLRGVVPLPERPVAVLDLDRLLSAPELAQLAAPRREARSA